MDSAQSQVYTLNNDDIKTTDHYANEIYKKTKILPSQCYFVNDERALFIKYPLGTDLNKWHNVHNLKALAELGLTPKMSQYDQQINTVFVNSAPGAIFYQNTEELLKHINDSNPNIIATGVYVPERKYHLQKMGSVKITVITRNMANSILHFGIKIHGCRIEPGSVRQGQYLSTPQCNYCSTYHSQNCSATKPFCPNCAGSHHRHECNSKNKPRCINCKQDHKSTSSFCPVRRKFLTADPIDDVALEGLICPYETPNKSPPIIPPKPNSCNITQDTWPAIPSNQENNNEASNRIPAVQRMMNPLVPLSPMTTYSDVMRMSLMFADWYRAFQMLMEVFGLPKVDLPVELRQMMKNKEPYQSPNNSNPHSSQFSFHQNKNTNTSRSEHPYTEENNTNPDLVNRIQQNSALNPNSITLHQAPRPQLQQTLTGANTIPLPQRPPKDLNGRNKSSKVHRPPLLPTPYDPFLPSYIRDNQKQNETYESNPSPKLNNNITESKKKGNNKSSEQDPNSNPRIIAEAIVAPRPPNPELAMSLPIPISTSTSENTQHNKSYQENRKSMDPEQFRSTIQTFQNLATATAATAQKDHFSACSNTNKKNNIEIPNDNIRFDIGTGGEISPEPKSKSRHTYKHKTPPSNISSPHKEPDSNSDPDDPLPQDSQDSQEDEEEEEEVDVLGNLPNISPPIQPRRQLRSNSNSTEL